MKRRGAVVEVLVKGQAAFGLIGVAIFGDLGLRWSAAACGVLVIDQVLERYLPIMLGTGRRGRVSK